MLSRHHWSTEFIGYVLRQGLTLDPDRAFDTAGELDPKWGDMNPEFAADSAFGPDRLQPGIDVRGPSRAW